MHIIKLTLPFIIALLMMSCSSDEDSVSTAGCNDPLAINYDANDTDNTNCMYRSDPYTGLYTFEINNCDREPEIFNPVIFRIEANDDDPNDLDLLMSGLTGAPVRFTGSISGTQVSFNSEVDLFSSVLTQGLNYQDELYAFVRFNLRGLLNLNGDTLNGTLSLETTNIAELSFGDRIFQVACDFTLTKA